MKHAKDHQGFGKGLDFAVVILTFLLGGYVIVVMSLLSDGSNSAALSMDGNSFRGSITSVEEVEKLKSQLEEARSKLKTLESRPRVQDAAAPLRLNLPPTPKVSKPTVTAKVTHSRSEVEKHSGVIILGMHRSGTSVIGGLLNSLGLNAGQPLIGPAEDNKKGFFERVDVVLQNDYLFKLQNVHYAGGTASFDQQKALAHVMAIRQLKDEVQHDKDKKAYWDKDYADATRNLANKANGVYGTIKTNRPTPNLFNEGERGLAFLNNESNYPWMLKDPRLCITIRTWIPLLKSIPAVLFTYRHPLDVASSLRKRDNFRMQRGLRMWYVYNMRAVQNSDDLCRVVSSHKAIMASPESELANVHHELRDRCGVSVPKAPTKSIVESFVDTRLNHGKSSHADEDCATVAKNPKVILMPPADVWVPEDTKGTTLYNTAMRAYCAMEDGSAFLPGYGWDESIRD